MRKHFPLPIFNFRLSAQQALGRLALLGLLLFPVACKRAEEALPAAEPSPAVTLSISTNQITVGDPVRVRITITHPSDTRAEIPEPLDSDAFTMRSRHVTRETLNDDRTRTVHDYWLTSFQVGTHPIATGAVRIVSDTAAPMLLNVPDTAIEVVSLLDDDTAFNPIRPLLDWPGRIPRWIPVLAGIAVLALAMGLLAARILSKPRTMLHQPPPRPAHETALNALRLLMTKGYIEAGEVDAFYTELSAIARHYLEDRFHLRAPESTTEEFIRDAANAHVLSAEHQGLVRDFLEQSDLVKFAQFRPGAAEMQDAHAAAERLIVETKQETAHAETPAP